MSQQVQELIDKIKTEGLAGRRSKGQRGRRACPTKRAGDPQRGEQTRAGSFTGRRRGDPEETGGLAHGPAAGFARHAAFLEERGSETSAQSHHRAGRRRAHPAEALRYYRRDCPQGRRRQIGGRRDRGGVEPQRSQGIARRVSRAIAKAVQGPCSFPGFGGYRQGLYGQL